MHEDFSWWYAPGAPLDAGVQEMLNRAADTILPTARMTAKSGLGAPWWVNAGDRAHLRWVRPEDEDAVMTALARPVSYTHLRAHETVLDLVCRLLLDKNKTQQSHLCTTGDDRKNR